MAKLYPPHIEGSLPAFCGTTLRIPFVGSRAVSLVGDGVTSMIVQFKDIQQSTIVGTPKAIPLSCIQEVSNNTYMITCNPGLSFTPGTYYKLQLAYCNAAGVGYFSDVGIIKYIQEPVVSIDTTGTHTYTYALNYKCSDTTEKLYSTVFCLTETGTTIGWSSGEIIHNTNKDIGSIATESYDFLQELDVSKNYEIYAIVTTSSGYVMETKHYPIHAKAEIPAINAYGVIAQLDYDNGCMNIGAYGENKSTLTGNFKIARADSSENYSIWHIMTSAILKATDAIKEDPYLIWRDFTVEQGHNYKYALWFTDSNNNLSNKAETEVIYADFEDAFLFDGDKQLRIRFDPKVTSFKTTLQETKIDTIGGRYPIIQRNGNTYYKEFAISGLLSHLSDPSGYFDAQIAQAKELDEEFGVIHNYTTNLNSENIAAERQFKLKVLDWLNNGKPKLFRSPTEGNYLVRLLNVSLSPNDTLGRMIHSFSATAYEIDSTDPETLIKDSYGILKTQSLKGIFTFDSEKGTFSYPLNLLTDSNYDLVQNNSDLIGKKILGAKFYYSYNPQHTLNVKINGIDTNVYMNDTYDGEVTSLRAGSSGFQPGTYDQVIFSYQNVLSLSNFNDRITDANSQVAVSQYYGFDLLNIFSGLKNFVQQVYKLVCKLRQTFDIDLSELTSIQFTYDDLQELLQKFLSNPLISVTIGTITKTAKDWIDFIISELTNCQVFESAIYIFNYNGQVCGFFDGCLNRFLTTVKNGVTSLLTTQETPCLTYILEGAQNIKNEFVNKATFYIDQIPSNVKNIVSNAFTCVEMIYRQQENIMATDWFISNPQSTLTLLDSYLNNNSLYGLTTDVMAGLKSSINLSSSTTINCETICNAIQNALSDGQIIPISNASGVLDVLNSCLDSNSQNNTNNYTITNVVEKTADTVQSLAAAAIQSYSNYCSSATSLTNITRDILGSSINVFDGLFGGMC